MSNAMDTLPQINLLANGVLIGLAAAGLWVWKQDKAERLRLLDKLVKLESDFASSVGQVADIHNQTAQQVTALADKVQAHGVAIAQVTGRR